MALDEGRMLSVDHQNHALGIGQGAEVDDIRGHRPERAGLPAPRGRRVNRGADPDPACKQLLPQHADIVKERIGRGVDHAQRTQQRLDRGPWHVE